MRKWLGMLLLAALGASVFAQTPEASNAPVAEPQAAPVAASVPAQARKYAVLSLIGDSVQFFRYEGERRSYRTIPMHGPLLDRVALLAANDTLEKAQPGGATILLAPTVDLYAMQRQLVVDGKFLAPTELAVTLNAQQVTHLLLITKRRFRTSVKFGERFLGLGDLEGLGYSLDMNKSVWRTDTKESSWGILVPYTNFAVSLIDVTQSAVVRTQSINASYAITSIGVKDVINPWDARTPEQNLDLLKDMVRDNVAAAVVKLL